ncbi:MAG: radical SAM protein [Candidatus Omnitrophica bacterium]|nr:radical SAM protein [Candidatus Omnitrophota bacterium]
MLPSYLKLYKQNRLNSIKKNLITALENCRLCPRNCGVNRLNDECGFCGTGRYAIISSGGPHFGEEPPLVGRGGSGTIFISRCNLGCIYCQNYTISHLGQGEKVKPEVLAKMMLYLQKVGCENINFVTPTHVIAQIVEALPLAIEGGLKLPLVYNSGGYDKVETLKEIEGVFDIYMPDAKYAEGSQAKKYSAAEDYWDICREAISQMHKDVGDLVIDENGIALRGLLIRHLILPNNIAGSFEVLDFIAKSISRNSYVNIMDQYRPCFKARDYPEINRPITPDEYKKVIDYALRLGLHRGF